jgi:hypothetical protein
VLTVKDRPGDEVDVEDELECDDEQPTTKMEAATATTRTKKPIRALVGMPNFDRLRASGGRALPINRPDSGGWIRVIVQRPVTPRRPA